MVVGTLGIRGKEGGGGGGLINSLTTVSEISPTGVYRDCVEYCHQWVNA